MSDATALKLVAGTPGGDGSATWAPVADRQTIIDTPGDELILVPALEWEQTHYNSPDWFPDLLAELNRRYPVEIPELPRVSQRCLTRRSYRTESLGGFSVFSQSEARIMAIPDATTAATLARRWGQATISKNLSHAICAATEALEEEDCYWRRRDAKGEVECDARVAHDGLVVEVVYDPKVIARRKVKRATREKAYALSPNFRKTGYHTTIKSFLTVYEVLEPLQIMRKLLGEHIPLSGYPFDVFDRSNIRRRHATYAWIVIPEVFNKFFGKNAHRRVPEFQKFVKESWVARRESTVKNWQQTAPWIGYSSSISIEELFDWWDRESKARRPPKRASYDDVVSLRLDGLPRHYREPKEETKRS